MAGNVTSYRARKTITFDGTAGNGSFGVAQVETATVAGTIGAGGVGNATVITTGTAIVGSPLTTSVAVANNDTATQVAGKIITALQGVTAITDFYTVGGSGVSVTLTAKTKIANDATLNLSTANGTCTGLTAAPTSANTTAGVALLPVAIFTETGAVKIISISGRVTTNLTGASGTIALGVTGSTSLFIAATTGTTLLTSAPIWLSTTATAGGLAYPAAAKDILIVANPIITVGTADITGGVLELTARWEPVSANGNLV